MIIDVNVPLGHDRVYDKQFEVDELLNLAREAGIDLIVVHPANPMTFEIAAELHDRIAKTVEANSKMMKGMAFLSPHWEARAYLEESERAIRNLGFVGLFANPAIHACHPTSRAGRLPFEAAKELKVPLMVHTCEDHYFSMPTNLFYLCREFSDVRVVAAHSGSMLFANQSFLLAKECPNVYLETSEAGFNSRAIGRYVRELGCQRVMMGSGDPEEMAHALWKYRNDPQTRLNQEQLEWCLGRTAREVFEL